MLFWHLKRQRSQWVRSMYNCFKRDHVTVQIVEAKTVHREMDVVKLSLNIAQGAATLGSSVQEEHYRRTFLPKPTERLMQHQRFHTRAAQLHVL